MLRQEEEVGIWEAQEEFSEEETLFLKNDWHIDTHRRQRKELQSGEKKISKDAPYSSVVHSLTPLQN